MGVLRVSCLALALGVPLATRAEPLPCAQDVRLSETAAALLLASAPLTAASLLDAARAHGFDGTAVHARETVRDEGLRSWLARLSAESEGRVTCGEARAEGRRLVLASVRGGALWLVGERLYGALEPGFEAPSLVFEARDGSLASLPVTREKLTRGVQLAPRSLLRRVQLSAHGAGGPRPLAELGFTPARQTERSTPRTLQASPGLTLAALRRDAGAAPLRDNRLLAHSAQQHASRVCTLGTLAHRIDGEDPEARLARAHVTARAVGEVIARAASQRSALGVLLDSPSHRLALLRADFTDLGIGTAHDVRGRTCLVVLLAAWPRASP